MATQIVMDHTGHTRHCFDPNDAQGLANAEKRFIQLTGLGFTAAVRKGPGENHQSAVSILRRKRLYSSRVWSAANLAW